MYLEIEKQLLNKRDHQCEVAKLVYLLKNY